MPAATSIAENIRRMSDYIVCIYNPATNTCAPIYKYL